MNTEKELAEEKMINEAFQGMLSTYLASKHRKKVDIITRAFNFAKHAHKGIRRNSGEPYILHPIAVARIVSEEIGLGSTSICAALLHDVVEDTDWTFDGLRRRGVDESVIEAVDAVNLEWSVLDGDTELMRGFSEGDFSFDTESLDHRTHTA